MSRGVALCGDLPSPHTVKRERSPPKLVARASFFIPTEMHEVRPPRSHEPRQTARHVSRLEVQGRSAAEMVTNFPSRSGVAEGRFVATLFEFCPLGLWLAGVAAPPAAPIFGRTFVPVPADLLAGRSDATHACAVRISVKQRSCRTPVFRMTRCLLVALIYVTPYYDQRLQCLNLEVA
jgi:hypothetical protein